MSQRVQLSANPQSHPHLFQKVDHSDIRSGDIYQGYRNPSKWYQNTEGQGCVESWRTYYRPVNSGSVTVTPISSRRMSHVDGPPQRSSASPVGGGGAGGGSAGAGATAGTASAQPESQTPGESEEDDEVVIKSVTPGPNGTLKVVAEITITQDTFSRFVADTMREVLNERGD